MRFVCIVEVVVPDNNTAIVTAVKDAFISNSCRRQKKYLGLNVKCMIIGPLSTKLGFC